MTSNERFKGHGGDLGLIREGAQSSNAEGEQIEEGEASVEIHCGRREEGPQDRGEEVGVGLDLIRFRSGVSFLLLCASE